MLNQNKKENGYYESDYKKEKNKILWKNYTQKRYKLVNGGYIVFMEPVVVSTSEQKNHNNIDDDEINNKKNKK